MSELPKTKPALHPTVKATGWVSFLTDFSSEMIYPLLPLFLTATLGVSKSFVGILEGLAETTASLLKLVSGSLSDRVGKRRPFVILGYTLSSLSRPLVALTQTGWQVLGLRVSDRIGKGLRSAPRDALVADVTPQEMRGRAFGYQRAMDHAGAVAGPIVAYSLLHWAAMDLRTVFALSTIPAALAVLTVLLWVRDAPSTKAAAKRTPISFAEWRKLDRRLLTAIGIIALFTLGNSSDAFLILRSNDLGVSDALIPILWVALHLVKSVTSTPAGALSDRLGRKRLIVAGWIVYALVYAGFAMAGAAWHAWALFLVYGTYFGLTEGAEKALVSDLARPEERGSAFGLYAFVIGLMALPASALTGWVWDKAGPETALGIGAGLSLAASLLLMAAPLAQGDGEG